MKLPTIATCLLLTGPAVAQTAVDGDTIKLNGTTYRIWGIDAPESAQGCVDGWPGGMHATEKLRELMAARTIVCEEKTKDRYGRTVALCRADGQDLGAAMVLAGLAWAFVRYTNDYVGQEARAKADHIGIHAFGCEPAWDWRARQRQ